MGLIPFLSPISIVKQIKMPTAEFTTAAENVKTLAKSPSNDEKLALYALYKQTTVGDCNTDKPGMLDVKGKAKWEAWNGKKGISSGDADAAYVKLVGELAAKYN